MSMILICYLLTDTRQHRTDFLLDLRPLSFYGLIQSLRSDSKFQDLQNANYEYEPLTTKILSQKVKKATTLMYKKLISNKSLTPESSQNKWQEDCSLPTNDIINWTEAKKCTKSTKLIEFQFKFLHRRVATNNLFIQNRSTG